MISLYICLHWGFLLQVVTWCRPWSILEQARTWRNDSWGTWWCEILGCNMCKYDLANHDFLIITLPDVSLVESQYLPSPSHVDTEWHRNYLNKPWYRRTSLAEFHGLKAVFRERERAHCKWCSPKGEISKILRFDSTWFFLILLPLVLSYCAVCWFELFFASRQIKMSSAIEWSHVVGWAMWSEQWQSLKSYWTSMKSSITSIGYVETHMQILYIINTFSQFCVFVKV